MVNFYEGGTTILNCSSFSLERCGLTTPVAFPSSHASLPVVVVGTNLFGTTAHNYSYALHVRQVRLRHGKDGQNLEGNEVQVQRLWQDWLC